jgi:glycogen debranching enzyme
LAYADWEDMIGANFERAFYIPLDPSLDANYLIDRPDLINRRGIYKDTYGSSTPFADYQLRPNSCIAMVKVRMWN